MKKCPLSFSSSGQPLDCYREECMWYDRVEDCCDIANVVRALNRISHAVPDDDDSFRVCVKGSIESY